MTSNQFSGKKQQRLMRFNEFVRRGSGKDRAGLLAEEIIEADITEAMFTLIDGSAPYEDRKQTMDRVCSNCMAFSEGQGKVLLMAVVVR
jgi:hypothetical protein